jgi:hypothetical protein
VQQERLIFESLRMAQALGLNWKKELQTYLAAYSLFNHSALGKSLPDLIFVRPVQTKLTAAMFNADTKTTHKTMSSWTRLLQENVWGRCSELDRDMPKEV